MHAMLCAEGGRLRGAGVWWAQRRLDVRMRQSCVSSTPGNGSLEREVFFEQKFSNTID